MCWVLARLASKLYPTLDKLSLDWRPWVTSAKRHYSQHIFVNNFCCKVKESNAIAAWQGKERQCKRPLQYLHYPLSTNSIRETGVFLPVPGNSSPTCQELTQQQRNAEGFLFIHSDSFSLNTLSFRNPIPPCLIILWHWAQALLWSR